MMMAESSGAHLLISRRHWSNRLAGAATARLDLPTRPENPQCSDGLESLAQTHIVGQQQLTVVQQRPDTILRISSPPFQSGNLSVFPRRSEYRPQPLLDCGTGLGSRTMGSSDCIFWALLKIDCHGHQPWNGGHGLDVAERFSQALSGPERL